MDFDSETSEYKYMADTLLGQISYLENKIVQPLPRSEKEAWNKAKQGFKFPAIFEVGTLGYLDLVEISQSQPEVSLKEYKELQLLDREQLLKKAAGIEIFYPATNKNDLFFYLTRGYLQQDINISEKINRWKKFDRLLVLSQDLILLMYGTQKAFAETPKSNQHQNIEDLIFLYDELLGLKNTPGVVSIMAGINVVTNTPDMDHYIYDKLYFYIDTYVKQTPLPISSGGEVLTLDEAIGMNKDEWKSFITRNFPGEESSHPFSIRSDFVLQTFYRLNY